jgi:hypothetical protein
LNGLVPLTKAVVELDEQIMLACIIEMGDVKEVYQRPLVPLMNGKRSSELALQTAIVMSIVQKGQDYLGRLKFSYFHMENADGLHFSLGGDEILAIMLKPQPVSNSLIEKIQELVEGAASSPKT